MGCQGLISRAFSGAALRGALEGALGVNRCREYRRIDIATRQNNAH
jgi:hypothetical protein